MVMSWEDLSFAKTLKWEKVSNTFLFFREILCYGEDCEIVSSDNVRQHFQQKIKAMRDRSQID